MIEIENSLVEKNLKIQIFGSSYRVFRCCGIGKRNLTPTVKHVKESMMFCGSFAGSSVGTQGWHPELKVQQQHFALPSKTLWYMLSWFTLLQDNDPKPTSWLCPSYLRRNEQASCIQIMEWPAQSPELNPISLVWEELDRRVKAKQLFTRKNSTSVFGCYICKHNNSIIS